MRQLLGLIVVAGLIGLVILLPDPRLPAVSAKTPTEWIAALGHDRDDVQSDALHALLREGAAVIPQLEAGILQTAEKSHRDRLFEVLEELLLSSDPKVADAAESALERLIASEHPRTAVDAYNVLLTHGALRHGRALTEFLRLGGKLRPFQADSERPFDLHQPTLVLDGEWRGTAADLRFPLRLFPGGLVQIHVTPEAPIGDDERRLLLSHPRPLRLSHPDAACLGVYMDETPRQSQVRVINVLPDSPAAQAGILEQDVIARFADIVPRRGLDVRLELVRFRPGDPVQIELLRENQTRTVRVTLGSEYATGSCRCEDAPQVEAQFLDVN